MSIIIRPAVQRDQAAIKAIVRAARINPLDLDWQRFLVAEDSGQIVGVGQVKPHRDGSRELASIAVVPERQRQGIGGTIIRALLGRETGPLYLMCEDHLETYYVRFGFRRVGADNMSPYFRRMSRLAKVFTLLASVVTRQRIRVIVMKRGL